MGIVDLFHLRNSLLPSPGGEAVREDGAGSEALTPAAVLFPIVLRALGQTVLLTERTAHLRDHGGQVSFPGGRVEENDASPAYTALRETREEIGIAEAQVEILGFLPEYRTSTGFSITPVVGLLRPPFTLQPDPFEVADIFEVPLAFLLDPANHRQHDFDDRGIRRRYYAMPYGERLIWGATAGMIRSLGARLGLFGDRSGAG